MAVFRAASERKKSVIILSRLAFASGVSFVPARDFETMRGKTLFREIGFEMGTAPVRHARFQESYAALRVLAPGPLPFLLWDSGGRNELFNRKFAC